ncbi:MAG: Kelch repeat-containing protein [Planctomycetota bacterium]
MGKNVRNVLLSLAGVVALQGGLLIAPVLGGDTVTTPDLDEPNTWTKLEEQKDVLVFYAPSAKAFVRPGKPEPKLKRLQLQWAYVPPKGKLYAYDGSRMATYDPKTDEWATVEMEPPEGGARWASLCYDPVNNELVQVGGHGPPFGTYLFDLKKKTWRKLEAGSEALRELHRTAGKLRWQGIKLLGRAANRFTIAETEAEAKADLGDRAEKLAEAAGKLEDAIGEAELKDNERAAAGHASKLSLAIATEYRELTDELRGDINPDLLSKLRALRVKLTQTEHALSPEPTPRGLTQAAYDPVHKNIVVFGGDAHDRVLSDTWVYDCESRTWEQRFPEVVPPPRAGHLLRWLPEAKTLVLASGYSRRHLPPDLWTYDVERNRWQLLATYDTEKAPRGARRGYPLVGDVAPGDLLVTEGKHSKRLWACRVDASAARKAETAKLGVAPGTFTFHRLDPAMWERAANPDPDRMKKFFEELPTNRWTAISFNKYAPGARNRWGTTAYDRDRHQFLFWGGGHATSMENEVAHFSIRGGCWTISYPPDEPLNRGSYMSWSGISFQRRPAMPSWHAYQAYEYDPSDRMFYLNYAYDVVAREWEPQAYEGLKHGGFARSMMDWTPHGITCYSRGRRSGPIGLYKFHGDAEKFEKMPWKGPHLKKVFCDSTASCYDSTRDCLWLSDHGIIRYDFKTGKATRVKVNPPKFMNVYGQCALLREAVHIPGDDLILIWRLWKDEKRQIAWEPKTRKYYWVDLPWVVDGKEVDPGSLSWHAGMHWDPEYKLIFMNDSRNRRVWALRFDRETAKMTELKPEPAEEDQ